MTPAEVLTALVVWCGLAVLVGLLVGAVISLGNRLLPPPPPEEPDE